MTTTPAFLSPLRVEVLGDRRFKLLEPLRYRSVVVPEEIIVPTGFVTNFASTPEAAPHAYFCGHAAAVVHDWLYTQMMYPRRTADLIFLEALRVWGVPPDRAAAMYAAVRIAGASAYGAQEPPVTAIEVIPDIQAAVLAAITPAVPLPRPA